MAIRINKFAAKSWYTGSEVIISDAPAVAKLSYGDSFQDLTPITTGNGTTNLVTTLTRLAGDGVSSRDAHLFEKKGDNTVFVRQDKGIGNGNGFTSSLVRFDCQFACAADAGGTIQRTLQVKVNGTVKWSHTFDQPFAKATAYTRCFGGTIAVPTGAEVGFEVVTTGTYVGAQLDDVTITFICA
jgi:hypothetical protein